MQTSFIILILGYLFINWKACGGQIVTRNLSSTTSATSTSPENHFHPVVINGNIGESDTRRINNTVEFIYLFTFRDRERNEDGEIKNEDIRIHVEVDKNSVVDYPVTFVVRQQKSSLTWQLPVLSKFDSNEYRTASRTLCTESDVALSQNVSGVVEADKTIECPILDQENNVQFEGYWQTMSKKAGMTLRKEDFPNGFYVVFVMHGDDSRCKRSDDADGNSQPLLYDMEYDIDKDRVKYVEFVIHEKITDIEYLAAIFGTGGVFVLVYFFVFIVSCTYSCRSNPTLVSIYIDAEDTNGDNNGETSRRRESQSDPVTNPESDISPIPNQPQTSNGNKNCVTVDPEYDPEEEQHWLADSDSSLDETDIDFMDDAKREKDVYRTSRGLCVAALVRKYPRIPAKKSQLYLYTLFTVAVFYGLPVVQLRYGIPRHYGLFYAMGFALMMEGVLSGCYHVCPNHSNFQFDTCFMYVNAILCMLKIYQTRHPDINASAYMAFTSLAFVVLLGVVGVMAGNLYFWIAFTIFHVLVCMYMSVQIYYLGRWRLDCGVFRRIYQTWKNDCIASPIACLTPLYIDRMILLSIAVICNWTIAGYGIWKMPQDFASHLLLIFMSNLFLHSNFYILMKLTHKEKISCQPAIYILLSVVFWSLSMYVFIHKSTSWQLSPAESRTYNRECFLLRFYDTHDIWHFLSAFSMFFSFMILLTLDDDLVFVLRKNIPVF